MAKSRKDNKGRVLRKGETVRSSNGMYQYAYTDAFGKRQFIYANDLLNLRQKEEEILRDRLDGINSEQAKNRSLNDIFDKYMVTRKDFAARTYASYMYQYDAAVSYLACRNAPTDLFPAGSGTGDPELQKRGALRPENREDRVPRWGGLFRGSCGTECAEIHAGFLSKLSRGDPGNLRF